MIQSRSSNSNKVPSFYSSHNLNDAKIEVYLRKPPAESFIYKKFKDITPEAAKEILKGCYWQYIPIPDFQINTALLCLNNNIQIAN